jgi:hypothetical protein
MFVATVFVTLSPAFTQVDSVLRHHSSAHKGCSFTMAPPRPNPSD